MADPYCLAMVLCDLVYRDALSGKMTILGTFSTIGSVSYPMAANVCIYFALTDGHGSIPISVRVVKARADISDDDPNGNLILELPPQEVNFPDPLAVIESAGQLQLTIPEPGHYRCELYAGKKLMMARRLLAVDPMIMGGISDA